LAEGVGGKAGCRDHIIVGETRLLSMDDEGRAAQLLDTRCVDVALKE
jgi:hypothetical protein